MIYVPLGNGEFISAVSLGAEHLEKADDALVNEVVSAAIDGGINFIDAFMPQPGVRDAIGKALKGRRGKVMLAGHLGASLDAGGQYERSRDEKTSLRMIEDFLRRTRSDVIDLLMLHFVDDPGDARDVFAPGGLCELAHRLKREGKARMIGMSSHAPSAARMAVESGMLDALMFPVNPLHDVLDTDDISRLFGDDYPATAHGTAPEKAELYRAALREGVAILAMKPYAAGRLLASGADMPPMTPAQCIHYALSQPGVVSAVCGCKSAAEVQAAVAYCTADDAEKDLAVLSVSRLWKNPGCMYCNHCLPCPVGIDVAEVTRLLDAAKNAGRPTYAMRDRMRALSAQPSACIACGACEENCPFGIKVSENMRHAAALYA